MVDVHGGSIVTRHIVERIVCGIKAGDDIVLEVDIADGITTQGGGCHVDKFRRVHTHRVEDHLYVGTADDVQRRGQHISSVVKQRHNHIVGNNRIIVSRAVDVGDTDTACTLGGVHLVAGDAATIIYMLSQHRVAGIGAHIVNHIAVHQHPILVHHTDGGVHLFSEGAKLNHVVSSAVIGSVTSECHANFTAIEHAVGHRHRVGIIHHDQCVARRNHRVAVHKLAVLKQAVVTPFTQLGQNEACVVRVSAVDETDIAEMDAAGLFKVYQRGNPCDGTLTTVRPAEGDHAVGRGGFKGHTVGSRRARNIGERGNTIVACGHLDGQGAVNAAAAQHIQAILQRGEVIRRAVADGAYPVVGAVTSGKGSEGGVVVGFMVAEQHIVDRDAVVDPCTHGVIAHGEHLVVVEVHAHTVSAVQHTRPVMIDRRLVVDAVPDAHTVHRAYAEVLQPHNNRVGALVARLVVARVCQCRHTAVVYQRQMFRLKELHPGAGRSCGTSVKISTAAEGRVVHCGILSLHKERHLIGRGGDMLNRSSRQVSGILIQNLHNQITAGIEERILQINHFVRARSALLHQESRIIDNLHRCGYE